MAQLKTLTRHFLIFPLCLALVWSAELPSAAQAPAAKAPARTPSLEAYRKYATTHEGDVARGARLFADEQRFACAKCHSVDGSASKAGPDLLAAGDKFGRRDLVDAMLMPSAVISPGYGTVIVATKSGEEYQGILKQATDAGVQLMGADGKLVSIATTDIKELQAADRNGNFTNILLTTDSLQKFQRFGGAAAGIGRVANRIAGARFELDGTTCKLAANSGKNTIHGGRKGFAQSVWTVESFLQKNNDSSVKLVYLSKDGEEGFPGNLKTSVIYPLTDSNELRMDYEAETDKPTIVNRTNHAYWNLAGGGSCLDNVLWIPSDRYTPADAALIPTGEILPLKGTLMDFNQPIRIGDRIQQLKKASGCAKSRS